MKETDEQHRSKQYHLQCLPPIIYDRVAFFFSVFTCSLTDIERFHLFTEI